MIKEKLDSLKEVFEQFTTDGLRRTLAAYNTNQLVLNGKMVTNEHDSDILKEVSQIAYG
jgi:hypothetical protein